MSFVLDASAALLWLAPETHPAGVDYASATLLALKETQALVPSLMALKAANMVAKLESKGLLTQADSQSFIALLGRLNIVIDPAQRRTPWATACTWRAATSYPLLTRPT